MQGKDEQSVEAHNRRFAECVSELILADATDNCMPTDLLALILSAALTNNREVDT